MTAAEPKGPSLQKIADHLGVSKARVIGLRREGMPVDTIKAAALWRSRQVLRRSPTNGRNKGTTRNVDPASLQPGKKVPKRRWKLTRSALSRTGDSLADSLADAITIAQDAFEAYQEAKMDQSVTMSSRLSEFNKALEGRQKAERLYREEMERRQLLVLKTEITERCRRCLEPVLRLLRKLPVEVGPQCNEQDPLKATKILQIATDKILLSGQQAMKGLGA